MTTLVIKPGLEAIAHQTDREFFDKLVNYFTLLKEETVSAKHVPNSPVNERSETVTLLCRDVYDHTGCLVTFMTISSPALAGWCNIPNGRKNHVFSIGFKTQPTVEQTSAFFAMLGSDVLKSTINLKEGRVSGAFSKINAQIGFTTSLFSKLDPDELAAFFVHELGHLMSYFEYFKASTLFDINLAGAIQEFTQADTPEIRLEIINGFKRSTQLKLPNADVVAKEDDPESFLSIVLSEATKSPRLALKSEVYDRRSWEAASDQYAARLGAGRALATGLQKCNKLLEHSSYDNLFTFAAAELRKTIFWTLLGAVTLGTAPLLFAWRVGNPYSEFYDEPIARLKRIRNDVLSSLRVPDLTKAQIQRILDDLDAIDALLKEGKDKDGLYRFFAALVSSNVRDQRKLLLEQKQLEYLANNDLYRHGAKFKLLS